MSDDFDMILDSEYNNQGELLGALDGATLGMMARMDPVKRAMVTQKLVGGMQRSRRSRAEMEKFFRQVPGHVKKGLVDGHLRLVDWMITNTKKVTSKTIKMFETQDDKETGITNISNAKLPKNSVFLVSGIYLLAGTADPKKADSRKSIDYKSIGRHPALANGFFSLKANKRQIVPDDTPMRKFVTDGQTNIPGGYWKLDNPRLIRDEELIEFTVDLGTMTDLGEDLHVAVYLDGTGTAP